MMLMILCHFPGVIRASIMSFTPLSSSKDPQVQVLDPPVDPVYVEKINNVGKKLTTLHDDLGYTYSNPYVTNKDGFGPQKVWRCSRKYKHCKASCMVDENNKIVLRRNQHNHDPLGSWFDFLVKLMSVLFAKYIFYYRNISKIVLLLGCYSSVEILEPPVLPQYLEKLSRGKKAIVLQDELGYTYSNKSMRNKDTQEYWRCSLKNKHCKASCMVDDGKITSRRYLHNHPP